MTSLWSAGSHAVQFYGAEPYVYHAIAEFFTQGADPGDALILVSRLRTHRAVTEQLAAGGYNGAAGAADRIVFIDAEAALSQIMIGETLDHARAEHLFRDVLSQAHSSSAPGTLRLYGETVDILCQHGNHAAALQLEAIGNVLFDVRPQLSVLCGYAIERFENGRWTAQLGAVCEKHTHVLPAESFGVALPVHTERAAMLQRNVVDRMPNPQSTPRLPARDRTGPAKTVYVIDDNANLRRALGRLLTASHWPVRTFDSAEAFLAEMDKLPIGCLVIDVQLRGMSGLDLCHRLVNAGFSWPIILMSGLDDKKIENEALRLGARAFLRKPFDSQALLDEIAQALL
jgi:CheY-like chemotaxis protein